MPGPRTTRHAALRDLLSSHHEPAYRLNQILDAVYRHGIVRYDAMTALPKRLRTLLTEHFGETFSTVRPIATQRGRQVDKVLFESTTGARIESVYSHFRDPGSSPGEHSRGPGSSPGEHSRGPGSSPGEHSRDGFRSLCISTQVGCGLGCTFCASGAVGLVRNLTADEICDQVLHWGPGGVDSVAFMGMGEALANPHMFEAIEILTDKRFFGFSPRRITVSTVGFLPGLERLIARHPKVTLTLSVHSPYEAERATLIPLQNRFPLRDNLELLDEHVGRTRRKAYLAYLLIADVNDSREHANALADLLSVRANPRLLQISVIPYNDAVGVNPTFRRPSAARTRAFLDTLKERNVHATKRQQFGDDIDAACGQLHARYLQRP